MKTISKLVTILGVTVFANQTFASYEDLLTPEKAMINIGYRCSERVFDQRRFTQAIARGNPNAQQVGYPGSTFNQQKYNAAIAAGRSHEYASEIATTFRYVDNSSFCVQYRSVFKKETLELLK
jgi:hypothetical protein